MWQFGNNIYHQDKQVTIALYKVEALERDMDNIWACHTELLPKLHDFQKQYFERRKVINDGQHYLHYTCMMLKPTY
jgi:hypothetical protein